MSMTPTQRRFHYLSLKVLEIELGEAFDIRKSNNVIIRLEAEFGLSLMVHQRPDRLRVNVYDGLNAPEAVFHLTMDGIGDLAVDGIGATYGFCDDWVEKLMPAIEKRYALELLADA